MATICFLTEWWGPFTSAFRDAWIPQTARWSQSETLPRSRVPQSRPATSRPSPTSAGASRTAGKATSCLRPGVTLLWRVTACPVPKVPLPHSSACFVAHMLIGQTSLPGSSTCFLASINNNLPFALQNEQDKSYLSEIAFAAGTVIHGASPAPLSYNPDTKAIVSVSNGYCLDDLGLTQYTFNTLLNFEVCSNDISQQFIYLPLTHQIQNLYNPNHKCLDVFYRSDSMSTCDGGGNPGSDPQQRWTVVPVCLPGQFSSTGVTPCNPCPPGM